MANRLIGMLFLVGPLSVASLTGCGDSVTGLAVPESGASMVDATALPHRPSSGAIPSTKTTPKADNGGRIDFDAEIGDCVRLGGTDDHATIEHATCASKESNYRIIGKARTNAQCVDDADAYYAETLNGVETGALCLDIDWSVGTCMDLSGDDPVRMSCSASTPDGVRVVEIQQNADDVHDCPTAGGFVYHERHFVVCTEDL